MDCEARNESILRKKRVLACREPEKRQMADRIEILGSAAALRDSSVSRSG
jgi:hypothetical protein